MLLPKLLAAPILLAILTAQTPPPLQEASAKPSLKNHAAGMRLQLSPQGLTGRKKRPKPEPVPPNVFAHNVAHALLRAAFTLV